ncbi:MAG: 4-hydroxy-tetrahydrodipicolinate reductase [Clostridiales bacterium]|jgi:4-hydroxy-tetrahydrodipicolinate reductase|nr:4-hydroxy-tetrahydrodipicolinate reductase [Clostridiales bacterium]
MLKIIVHGLGRLGLSVCRMAAEDMKNDCKIVAGIDIAPPGGTAFPIYADLASCADIADVVVDCSVAPAVSGLVSQAVAKKMPLVICTTALDDGTIRKIHAAAEKIPVFVSANMSLGIHLMSRLSQMAAKALADAGFDIEIIEKHHSGKLDAPSGTANMLAKGIIDQLGHRQPVYDRSGRRQRRDAAEIGMHAIRGGSIVGEHTVLFAGEGETLEITHNASSREIYARGILRAAKLVAAKPAGLYGMDDLLT